MRCPDAWRKAISTDSDAIPCILNGAAGSNRARLAQSQLDALFAAQGARANVLLAQGEALTRLARQQVERGSRLVVAGGGDGTVNAVATALIGTDAVLGVLPLGTLNHFAKDLKIPLALEAAVSVLFAGASAEIDVGEVNGRPFLNNSSLGLYPAIVRTRDAIQSKGRGKWPAFAQATLFALRRSARLSVSLQVDGQERVEQDTAFIFVGNNRYEVAGLHIGERARLDGANLWVCSAPRTTHAGLFRLALQALMGHPDPRELKVLETAAFRVGTRRKHLDVATDGEVNRLSAPLNYRILPRALRVMVPAAAETAA